MLYVGMSVVIPLSGDLGACAAQQIGPFESGAASTERFSSALHLRLRASVIRRDSTFSLSAHLRDTVQ